MDENGKNWEGHKLLKKRKRKEQGRGEVFCFLFFTETWGVLQENRRKKGVVLDKK